METELYKVQVTFDETVDNTPWTRTHHVVTAKGSMEAINVVLERLALCVTKDPEGKITEMTVIKIHKDNFILADQADAR